MSCALDVTVGLWKKKENKNSAADILFLHGMACVLPACLVCLFVWAESADGAGRAQRNVEMVVVVG